MAWLETAIKAAGTVISFFGQKKEAESVEDYYKDQAAEAKRIAAANAEISLYDATVAEKDAFYAEQAAGSELRIHIRQVDKVLGAQRARYAKAGVVVGSGSPLDTMNRTIDEGIRDAEIIAHEGFTAAERRRSLASRYRLLAEKGLRDASAQASLLEQAGSAAKISGYWSAAGDLLSNVYDIGEDQGWFK